MAKIFLCHANEDKPQVREIYQRLKSEGFEPWLDEENLLPGQLWDQEIRRALRESDFILIFFSQNSVAKRGYVQREMKLALDAWEEIPEGMIHTIPVRLDDCEIPERFQRFQRADFFVENGYEKLVQGLRAGLEQRQPAEPDSAGTRLSYTPAQPDFQEIQPVWKSSSFLKDGEILTKLIPFGNRGKASNVIWYNSPQSFFRLIPTRPITDRTSFELLQIIETQDTWLAPFGRIGNTWSERNKYGAVRFDAKSQERQNTADCFSQVFKNGEIWGILKLLDAHEDQKIIPSSSIEEEFESALRNYLHIAQHGLGLDLPLRFVAGLSDVEGFSLGLPPGFLHNVGGDVLESEIIGEGIVSDYDASVHVLLLPFFERVWNECGLARPPSFRQASEQR